MLILVVSHKPECMILDSLEIMQRTRFSRREAREIIGRPYSTAHRLAIQRPPQHKVGWSKSEHDIQIYLYMKIGLEKCVGGYVQHPPLGKYRLEKFSLGPYPFHIWLLLGPVAPYPVPIRAHRPLSDPIGFQYSDSSDFHKPALLIGSN